MAQLAFKQAKFYLRIKNDRAKGRMGPRWIMRKYLATSTSIIQVKKEVMQISQIDENSRE